VDDHLLKTKFFIPPTRPVLVPRPHLTRQLDAGLHRKLTLISAPAGFGKTTMVTEWLEHLRDDTKKGNLNKERIAWLSLDESDNELVRFLTYIVTAINQIEDKDADICKGALTMIQSPVPPATGVVLTSLINEVATIPGKILLILDDYQRIEAQPIHAALDFLLDNLPPQMHLIIATREDPLLQISRLRARDQLTELRAADLRFSSSEAAEFLNHVMGLDLSVEDIDALESRTEGWIAGLQLAALSIQGVQAPKEFIKSFTGSHRLVLDYLIEEVLERQPENIQTFLLQTSILEKLNGSLCDSLNDQVDGQATLEMLERANLFIVPLDNERCWYRYHHLFADLLRQRLNQKHPELIPMLHSQASEWFEVNGHTDKAVEYSLKASNYVRAARLLELAWLSMSSNFRSFSWLSWAKKLPDDLIRTRPVLCAQYAGALLEGGELEASESRFQDAERWLEESSDNMVVFDEDQFQALPAAIANGRAQIALAHGDIAGAVKIAERALKLSPDECAANSHATVLLGLTYWADGDLEAAHRAMADWVNNMQKAGNLYFAIASIFGLADIRIAQGRLCEAERTYKQSLQLVSEQDTSIRRITAHHHLGLAMIYHEKGDQEAFAEHLHKSRELGEQTTLVDWPYRWHLAQARLKTAENDWATVLYELDEARRLYVRSLVPDIQPIEALKARVYISQSVLAEVRNWISRREITFDDNLNYLSEFEHITLARFSIAEYKCNRSEGNVPQAIGLLKRLLKAAEDKSRMGSVIEILVVLSLAYEVQANISSALIPLKKALTLAEPEGYIHIFVDEGPPMAHLLYEAFSQGITLNYVRRLLAALPDVISNKYDSAQIRITESDGIEPISAREIEVLQLISEGLTNQEIADRLYLSLHTVKGHARNIYSKLGVKNRTQAVTRGKVLGILLPD
jgi:LuxR family maltose regulon positive regulatory protein